MHICLNAVFENYWMQLLLLRIKIEKLYDFIAAESNHYDVNTYLSHHGYR